MSITVFLLVSYALSATVVTGACLAVPGFFYCYAADTTEGLAALVGAFGFAEFLATVVSTTFTRFSIVMSSTELLTTGRRR